MVRAYLNLNHFSDSYYDDFDDDLNDDFDDFADDLDDWYSSYMVLDSYTWNFEEK